jgi:hypothetical protein
MRLMKRRQGIRDQVMDVLVSALTESNGQPEPKRRRRGGKRSIVAGAALYAAGHRLAQGRAGEDAEEAEEPDQPRRRVRVRS